MESVLLKQGTTLDGLQEKLTQEGITCQETNLDIADGSIQLKENGYIQGTEPLVECNGKYIITGQTTENNVRVIEKGTYNITLKDLDIRLANKTPIICNANRVVNGLVVNITLKENNYLESGYGSALSFDMVYNTEDEVTSRSTISFNGEGSLTANDKDNLSAVIGSSYGGTGVWQNCKANLIINSGIFNIGPSLNGDCFGAGVRGSGFFITINGGNIIATSGEYGRCIGGSGGVLINGGSIMTKGWSRIASENIVINGGTMRAGSTVKNTNRWSK